MTTLEYMEKQLNKHKLNLKKEQERKAPQEVIDNISKKIGYYGEAVEALVICDTMADCLKEGAE